MLSECPLPSLMERSISAACRCISQNLLSHDDHHLQKSMDRRYFASGAPDKFFLHSEVFPHAYKVVFCRKPLVLLNNIPLIESVPRRWRKERPKVQDCLQSHFLIIWSKTFRFVFALEDSAILKAVSNHCEWFAQIRKSSLDALVWRTRKATIPTDLWRLEHEVVSSLWTSIVSKLL